MGTRSREADDADVLKVILTVVNAVEYPLDVDAKGIRSLWQFLERETPTHRSHFRKEVLQTKPEQLQDFAARLRSALDANVEAAVMVGPESAAQEVIVKGE